MCHLFSSASGNNGNGSRFEAKTTFSLSPAVVDTQTSEFSVRNSALKSVLASNSICIPVAVVQKRFANVGQFCVDYSTGILAGSVIYASVRTRIWELRGVMAHILQLELLWEGEFDKGGILVVHRQFEEVLSICHNSRSSGAVLELYADSHIEKRTETNIGKPS